MAELADKYVSKSGRTSKYDRAAVTDDLLAVGLFLVWAEDHGTSFAGIDATDALRAVCRLLDVDPRGLRKAIMAEAD